jgi:hypothetical protein
MSELLLQTIIEKLEAMELLLKAESADKTDVSSQKQITEQFYQLHKEIRLLPAQLSLSKEQSLLDELMRVHQMQPSLPYELLQKKRKKKQSQGHHL